MDPSFSIIATLVEAAKLAWRHGKLVLVLAIICSVPSVAGQCAAVEIVASSAALKGATAPPSPGYLQLLSLFIFVVIIVEMVVAVAMQAAILGILKTPATSERAWPVIRDSVRRYIWPLFILSLLLAIIAFLITVPFGFILGRVAFGATESSSYLVGFLSMLIAILYLVFAKYALADPLVVVENLNPLAALGRSWRMTRGRFGYVVGCYIFVGTGEYFLSQLAQYFEISSAVTWVNSVDAFINSVIACYWIFLAWVMYMRIKAAEAAG